MTPEDMSEAPKLPPLPERLRAMFCTKCGYRNGETEAPLPHAPCENSNCQYTAFVTEREFTADQMHAYATTHAAALAARVEELTQAFVDTRDVLAGERAVIAALRAEVEALRVDAERWRWIEQFLSIDDVGDESAVYGLVVNEEAMTEAAWRARMWSASEYLEQDPTPSDAIDAARTKEPKHG